MKRALVLLTMLILAFTNAASAVERSNQKAEIVRLISYAEAGGDVYIKLATNGNVCTHGYYLSKSSPGFDANLSVLLAAKMSNSPIYVYGYENQLWSGSSQPTCKIYSVEL